MNLPSFHERNPRLLEEAKVLLDKERTFIGASMSGTQFYGLGSFHSDYLGREIYGGVKKNFWNEDYFYTSLANILLLEEKCPEPRDFLPLFFGGIKTADTLEIIMEDFSREGEIVPFDLSSPDYLRIPDAVKGLMHVDPYHELTRAFVEVDRKLKMMDFDTIPWNNSLFDESQRLAFDLRSQEDKLEPYLIRP